MRKRPPSSSLRKRLAAEEGTTLVEVLVAASLLVVVMFWLTQYYVQGRKHFDYEEDRRRATAVAQARLDEVKRWSYDYSVSLVDSTGAASVDTVLAVDGRDYAVSLFFTPGPNANSATVHAVVDWVATLPYDPDNVFSRSDTVTTVLGRPYPYLP